MSLDFQESFEPERPEPPHKEQEDASELFDTIVDSALLTFQDHRDSKLDGQVVELTLYPVKPDTGIESVKVMTAFNSYGQDRYIHVEHAHKEGQPRRTSTYERKSGDMLSRMDTINQDVAEEEAREAERAGTYKQYTENRDANNQMAQDWGYNGQHIGMIETNKMQTRISGMLPR